MESILAIYENGQLRPLQKIDLAEHSRVRIQIIDETLADSVNLAQYPLMAFANLGKSSETDVSERAEEILAREIKSVEGWSTKRADSH